MRYAFIALAVLVLAGVGVMVDRATLSVEEAHLRISQPPSVDWMAIEDNPKKLVELSWMPLPRFPNGREGAYGQRRLEELFNVKIEPILLDKAGYGQQKPMMFASGDIPDVVWDGNPSDVHKDIHHGCIRPIPLELIQKHAPTYFDLITNEAPLGWLYTDFEGNNWGLPIIWPDGALPAPGVWRRDWLDAVGIEKSPETLDEFEEAFRRFTFNDPDGNGRDDTYGLTNTTIGWHLMFSEFFGAYGVLPFDWQERDGKIVWGGISPEAKMALARIRRWNEEGILDPEWLTDGLGERRRLKEKLMNGRIGYAYSLGVHDEFDQSSTHSLVSVMAQLNPDASAQPAKLPVGPEGLSGVRNWGAASNIYVAGPGVIDDPLRLVRLLKMMDYQLANGEDTYLEFRYGQKGLHWDYEIPDLDQPGGGSASGMTRLDPYVEERDFQSEVLTIWGTEVPEYEEGSYSDAKKAFNRQYRDRKGCLLNVIGRPAMVPSAQLYLEDLRTWQTSVYTDIIRGELPLDYFDVFAQQWMERGGAQMTAEAQQVLERKKVLFDKVAGMAGEE